VQFELTRYLSDNWVPVIEKDVDGPNSLPLRLDGEVPNLGKFAACRRVARTIAAAELIYNPKIDVRAVEDEFYGLMARLEFLPNSPTLMIAERGAEWVLAGN